MNKVLEYLKQIYTKPIFQKITVYGWIYNYEYQLIGSALPYLFEKLDITENLAFPTNTNRPQTIKEKKYIVIHDTGDTSLGRGAKYWSQVVKEQKYENKLYEASFQYVVGNDGIYHNIPDDEVAYHAGDGTKYDYTLYDTHIKQANDCKLTIKEGYYYINGQNTNIKVPDAPKALTTSDLNDNGILCVVQNGTYHLGETYFNQTYQKIANRGGNNNGIGIEMCIDEKTDLYLNYQRLAKLCAMLLDKYHLDLSSIRPHHYFSGKDCPMTARKNHLWDHFMKLVEVEKAVLSFIKEGYEINLIPKSSNILSSGRIINDCHNICFIVTTKKDNIEESYEFSWESPSC